MMRNVFVIAVITMMICSGCNKPVSGARIESLKQRGNEIIAELNTFHGRRSYYPESLTDLDIDTKTDYGAWDYEGHRDKFFLVVGNHKKYGFMLSWNPNKGMWEEFRSR